MAPSRRIPALLVLFVLALVGLPRGGLAQGMAPDTAGPVWERAALRLRYGVSLRAGEQVDSGPGLTYSGLTPNDTAVGASVYGPDWLGGWLGVQREAFSLYRQAALVSEGSLLRASAGAVGRLRLGPVRAELSAGYGFAQLPLFADSSTQAPAFQRGGRHAALVGGRVRFPLLLRAQGEVRGELPLVLAASDAAGGDASSSGFAAGLSVLYPLRRVGRWEGSLVLDYQYIQDRLSASGARSDQTLQRMGMALELSWFDTDAPLSYEAPARGGLALRVVDAETGAPLPGAQVTLAVAGGARAPLAVDAEGRALEPELEPGEVVAQVSAEGYQPAEGRATVVAGERATLEVRARKLPPQVGRLSISVVDKSNGAPLQGAAVVVGGQSLVTDAAGQVRLEGVAPGPVSVKVSAGGFHPVEEAALIVAGQEAALPVQLAPARRVGYATLSGRVRSTQEGRSIIATLVLPSAKVRTRTDAQGAFSLKVKPGTYRIIISAKGHLTQTKSVTLRDGEQAIFNVDLFPRARSR